MDLIQALTTIQRYAAQDIITSITIHQHAGGQMIVTAFTYPDGLDIIAKDTGAVVRRYIDAGGVQIKAVR
jgi:hypothetical protein